MTTEKELAAFVERVAKEASLKGSQRAAFIVVRPLIERALAAGHSMKATWKVLHAERRVMMTYETFRAHCRQAGLGRAAARPDGGRAQAGGQSFVTSGAELAPAQRRPGDPPQGFQHSRVPRKKDIY